MKSWKYGDLELVELDSGDFEFRHEASGTVLEFSRPEMWAFVQGVRAGEFTDSATDAMTASYQDPPAGN